MNIITKLRSKLGSRLFKVAAEVSPDKHPGRVRGGKKASKTNVKRYGKDFYQQIGALGGKKSTGGGFARNRELAREAGAKGGTKSKRTKKDAL